MVVLSEVIFFVQAEDGIRDLVRSRGLGDVYKRQPLKKRIRIVRVGWPVSSDPTAVASGQTPRRVSFHLSLIHI